MAENWVVWFNGKIVPETEARVPFRDRGFKYGDAAFDTTRTFGHQIFKLDEHLAGMIRQLRGLPAVIHLGDELQQLHRLPQLPLDLPPANNHIQIAGIIDVPVQNKGE